MKRISFLILSTCIWGITFGQTSAPIFSLTDTTAGTSHITGYPVTATRYVVPGKLSGWHWDGHSNNLLLELKEPDGKGISFTNKGILNMVDMETKNVKWARPINYNSSEVRLLGNYYFLSEKKKNYRLHPETGEVLWANRNEFYFIDPFLNIGVGYPLQSLSNKLTAVDLSNGKELWRKKVNRISGWDDAYMLDDATLLISVDGIQAVNLKNGKGWTYKADTSKKEIGKMIGFNAINIILGLIFDYYEVQTEPDTYSDMVSNMLIDPLENTILASKDRISKIDKSGTTQWSTSLPEKKTSKSSLFLIDNNVFMINRGYAQYNRNFSTVGTPYFASFDLQSGKQLFLISLADKNEFIRNFLVVDDRLFVVFDDKITAHSISDGSEITEKTFALLDGELLDAFVYSGIYWKGNEPFFQELATDFSAHNFMMTSTGRIFVLTDNLETVMVYDQPDLYHKVTGNNQYMLVSNNDTDFILLDNSFVPVGTIKATADLLMNEDKLFFFDADSFWEINLNQFQQPPSLWHSIFKNLSQYMP